MAPVPAVSGLVEAETPLKPQEEERGTAAGQMVAQREAHPSERSGDLLAGESRRREALERVEGSSRAKLDLSRRRQGCLITEASLRAATLTEEAGRREVMRGCDRAGVKEGYRHRETKQAERRAWRKLMGNCSGRDAGARRRTWKRDMLARRENDLHDGMQLFSRWIA